MSKVSLQEDLQHDWSNLGGLASIDGVPSLRLGVQKRQTGGEKEDGHHWKCLERHGSDRCNHYRKLEQLTASVNVRRPLVSIRNSVGMVATT